MGEGHIFISYRREDSAGYTRAIFDQLTKHFSKSQVFMDVDTIEPGLPFDEVINQAVARCDVLLVMVGARWMEPRADSGPRLNDPKDFVRIEIAAALSRNIRVIPVLLDGATMPAEDALPEPLRPFARRNAIEVGNSRFDSDVERLIDVVGKSIGEPARSQNRKGHRSRRVAMYLAARRRARRRRAGPRGLLVSAWIDSKGLAVLPKVQCAVLRWLRSERSLRGRWRAQRRRVQFFAGA